MEDHKRYLKQLVNQSFVLLWRDKEILAFVMIPLLIILSLIIIDITVAILPINSAKLLSHPFGGNIAFALLFAFLIAVLAVIFMFFVDAAIILTVEEREKGGSPRFFSTCKKVISFRKIIFYAIYLFISRVRVPNPVNFHELIGLIEIFIKHKLVWQEIDEKSDYITSNTITSLIRYRRILNIHAIVLLSGFILYFLSLEATKNLGFLGLDKPVFLNQIRTWIYVVAVILFIFDCIIFYAVEKIYQTLLYISYLKGENSIS